MGVIIKTMHQTQTPNSSMPAVAVSRFPFLVLLFSRYPVCRLPFSVPRFLFVPFPLPTVPVFACSTYPVPDPAFPLSHFPAFPFPRSPVFPFPVFLACFPFPIFLFLLPVARSPFPVCLLSVFLVFVVPFLVVGLSKFPRLVFPLPAFPFPVFRLSLPVVRVFNLWITLP